MTDTQALRDAIREAIARSQLHDTSVRVNVPAAEDELVEAVRATWPHGWDWEPDEAEHSYEIAPVCDIWGWTPQTPPAKVDWSITVKLRTSLATTDGCLHDKYTTEEES